MADTLKWLWGMNYYQARSRIWKRAAKKWRRRFLVLCDDLMEEHDDATRRKELLRRCKFVIDVSGEDNKEFMRQFDSTLFDELARELANDND
jgi:hypothetical protein